MLVEVGDLPAVCHNMTCDFTYIPNVGEITAFTFTEGSKLLTVTGTNLPTEISGIQSMSYALAPCQIDPSFVMTGTSIQCTLQIAPTVGDFHPVVTTPLGNIPYAEGLAV
jgi:hypothetical protein